LAGWIYVGDQAPIDLLKLLRELPFFNAVRYPDKYCGIPIVCAILIVSGRSFDLLRKIPIRWAEHVVAILLIASTLGFQVPRMREELNRFTCPPLPKDLPQQDFYQIKGKGLERRRVFPLAAHMYFNLIQNIGTIDFDTNMSIGEKAIPRYYVDEDNNYITNPEYRGEAYCLAPGNAARAKLHPNSILVEVVLRSPDTLVINQNYHPDWSSNRGELFERKGLLALRLPEAGRYAIRLRYHPRSFYAGLAISSLSLAALLWFCWAYRTKRLSAWAGRGSPAVRRASRWSLWLIDG
jgi:hypothetical protein